MSLAGGSYLYWIEKTGQDLSLSLGHFLYPQTGTTGENLKLIWVEFFNFKFSCCDDVSVLSDADAHPHLQLKTPPMFSPVSLSLSMRRHYIFRWKTLSLNILEYSLQNVFFSKHRTKQFATDKISAPVSFSFQGLEWKAF
jgi:hypothetical protein